MAQYILKRILGIILVLWVISMVTFALMHAVPGGPWDSGKWPIQGAAKANLEKLYGLDKPIWQQYLIYMGNALRGDFGHPFSAPEETVFQVLARTWPVSLQLAGLTVLVWVPIGFLLGVIAAFHPNSIIDYFCTLMATIGLIIPSFVLAFFFILVFGVLFKALPTQGWNDSRYWILGGLVNKTWIMPVTIWGLGLLAPVARYTRAAILDVIKSDYVRTARAKGLKRNVIFFRHILRNAMIPIIAVVFPMIPGIVTGNNWIERIFSIPGIGRYFVDAVLVRDYVLIMAVMLLFCLLLTLNNLIIDLLYMVVDPRIRLEGGKAS